MGKNNLSETIDKTPMLDSTSIFLDKRWKN